MASRHRRAAFGRTDLTRAGEAWKAYASRRDRRLRCPGCAASLSVTCPHCGAPFAVRQHLIADFLIGAQAEVAGAVLLTRDRGFYRAYFPNLRLSQAPDPGTP